MFFHNPFDSWADSAGQSGSGNTSAPSVFGALPYPNRNTGNTIDFYFTSFKPNIFNSSIVGYSPSGQPQVGFKVVTDDTMPGYTVIKTTDGKNVSLIEWQSHPFIEIRGVLTKQNVKSWLPLSSDKSYRTMTIRGMQYTWAPRDKSINLYAPGSKDAVFLAKITRGNGSVTLQLTQHAMQLNLLDAIIAAAFLLQCGRNID